VNQEKANISKVDWEVLLRSINSFVFDVMGLQKLKLPNNENNKIKDVLDVILELRDDARKNKNYELSDKIRDMLKNKGISINDSDKNSSFTID
jgi:cysteinyl-tRNA synthetase